MSPTTTKRTQVFMSNVGHFFPPPDFNVQNFSTDFFNTACSVHRAKTNLQNQPPKHVGWGFVRFLCTYSCVCKVGLCKVISRQMFIRAPKTKFHINTCTGSRARIYSRTEGHDGGTVQMKCDGTRWRTGGEMKGKLANTMGSQYPSHYLGTWCIQDYYRWCAHLGCQ